MPRAPAAQGFGGTFFQARQLCFTSVSQHDGLVPSCPSGIRVYVGPMNGSIRQIKKNYWLLRVDQGRDPISGKRIQASRTLRGTRRQAEDALDELRLEVRARGTASTSMTLNELTERCGTSMSRNPFPKLDELPNLSTISVEDAANLIGISRQAAYDAANRGELPIVRAGRRIRVKARTL
jgi:excisionase family DNA binding protein